MLEEVKNEKDRVVILASGHLDHESRRIVDECNIYIDYLERYFNAVILREKVKMIMEVGLPVLIVFVFIVLAMIFLGCFIAFV